MIVVDTNILAYLYLPLEFTAHAEQLLLDRPDWVVLSGESLWSDSHTFQPVLACRGEVIGGPSPDRGCADFLAGRKKLTCNGFWRENSLLLMQTLPVLDGRFLGVWKF